MGKAEVGTPKYIANKIKAKGLQKLRWYCQMCEKQCRDENGFKCHTLSESHQRQLLLFAENPHKYMDEFSRKFVKDFLDLLRCMFGTKRVLANKVYQEYITDRKHLHMNATQWETLTDFVKWLGKAGKCVVDETEKGWFITYIDRNPEMIRLQEQAAKKQKMEKDEEEEMAEFLKKQIERGKATSNANETKPTELKKNENEKITINLGASTSKVAPKLLTTKPSVFVSTSKMAPKLLAVKPSVFGDDRSKHKMKTVKKSTDKRPPPNILEEIMKEDQRNMYKKTKRY